MNSTVKHWKCRVFIASSSDVREERERMDRVISELNETVAPKHNMELELVKYETHSGPAMGRPQDIINPLVDGSDIFVGVLWRRFGIPTGHAEGGTEEEFLRAYSRWSEVGTPDILFYFSSQPFAPPKDLGQIEQLSKVVQFRTELETKGLIGEYEDPAAFERKVRLDLSKLLDRLAANRAIPKLSPSLRQSLDAQVAECSKLDKGFMSPSLLLGLLDEPNGLAMRCLNAAKEGLGPKVREKLVAVIQATPVERYGSFRPVRLEEFDTVQEAGTLATDLGSNVIDERILFLALLRSDANTTKSLKNSLGTDRFRELVDLVEAGGPASSGTIGIDF